MKLELTATHKITKCILLGDSGTGKTGALASLVKAGYKLRVLDLDNKLASGILPQVIKRECADKNRECRL